MKVFERRKYVSDKRLCFNCLRLGHGANECRLTRTCGIEGCNQRHTKFLHPLGPRSESSDSSSGEVNCNATTGSIARLALPIVAVKVRAPGGGPECEAYALLDNGSTTTFCTQGLAQKIGVQDHKETGHQHH